jgi:hypothetical protein
MARKETLTVKLIENLAPKAKAYRVSDGGGLLLAIYPGGSKAWLARTTVNGRRRDVGLGGFPIISLAEARAKALEARRLAGEGRDPSAEKKAAPQCWSGDHSKFFDAGTKTAISGVNVECKATSDGKAAQWVGGGKH